MPGELRHYNGNIMTDDLNTELARRALEPLGDLLGKLAGPLADEVGETFGIWARQYRVRQGLKMLQKTQRMLKEAGLAPQAVSPRLFLPILEHASIENDEDLHSRWAALLANASACPNSVHPSFVEILGQLTPDDAQVLHTLYDASRTYPKVGDWTYSNYLAQEGRMTTVINPKESFQNLVRLGLIQPEYDIDRDLTKLRLAGNGTPVLDAELESHYEVSEFAVRFVQACRAPHSAAVSAGKTA